MKFLKSLLGKESEKVPTWNIRPASERPAPKPRKVSADALPEPAPAKKESNPFFDDEALNALQLEADAIPDDNPYSTYTWEQDLENDTRKLKTIQIGEKTEKKPGSEFNPYDTGQMRRGWKK
jgi:hypothetical protein